MTILASHLAGDQRIPSSLASHVIFNRTGVLVDWALEAFDTDQLAFMLQAVGVAGERDPFGYVSSQAAARREIVKALKLDGDSRPQAHRTVQRLDGNRLLYMVIVTSRGEVTVAGNEPLGDVLSLEALAQALTEVERVRSAIAQTGDLRPIAERDVPDIGRVAKRFAEAQSDLRKMRAMLTSTG